MTPSLLRRRQKLVDRSDAALERWPERTGRQFAREMSQIAEGLEALAKEADAQGGNCLERCRTWRYAGNAYFDLGNGKDLPEMKKAVSAFKAAEPLLDASDDPVERMKLNYSLGHALFHLSDATDVTLAQEARDRYAFALTLARNHLPEAAGPAQQALANADRLLSTMHVISGLDSRRNTLERELAGLDSRETEADDAPAAFKNMFGQLQDLYQRDVANGTISPVRQQALDPVLEALGSMVNRESGDLAQLTTDSARLHELAARMGALIGNTGQAASATAPSGSRAEAVWDRMATIKKDLAADMKRPHGGSDEFMFAVDLYKRCGHADTFVHQNGRNETWMREYEGDVLRPLSAEIRAYSRRYHLTLARPVWPSPPVTPDANAVFYSGGSDVEALVSNACDRIGLTPLAQGRKPKNYAAARWDQCRTAGVAVFDFTAYRPGNTEAAAKVAGTAYELGIAFTLGRPLIIVATEEQDPPFDVNVDAVRLDGGRDDGSRLADALDEAVYSSRFGSTDSALQPARDDLVQRFANHANVVISQSARMIDGEPPRDPVTFRRAVDMLVGAAGSEAPIVVFPEWPGLYPQPLQPRLFHVTPFGPSWAGDTMKVAANVCGAAFPKVEYVRGDQVLDPDIMRSIWDNLCRATHVLVDLTALNANVMFELGVAHVLGRNVLLLSQDDLAARVPSIAKTRIHRYHVGSGPGSLDGLVERFVAGAR